MLLPVAPAGRKASFLLLKGRLCCVGIKMQWAGPAKILRRRYGIRFYPMKGAARLQNAGVLAVS
jgi:hypothetical protein